MKYFIFMLTFCNIYVIIIKTKIVYENFNKLKSRGELDMRKKILAVVAATVITTLAFTGCGKSNESKSGSDKGVTGEINVISREENSGTRGAFVELMGIVDGNDNDITTQTAEVTNSTSVMLSTVAQNEKAIGYVSLGSLSTDVKALKVDGVEATTDNIKAGKYKVARPFNLAYQDGKLTKLDEDFIKDSRL